MTAPERPAFVAGELVQVVIPRAEVMAVIEDGAGVWLNVAFGDPVEELPFPLHQPGAVQVQRLAPAEWPPVAGDLWRDRDGDLWFAYHYETHGEHPRRELRLQCSGDQAYTGSWNARRLLAECGPVQLVHREPQPEQSGEDL